MTRHKRRTPYPTERLCIDCNKVKPMDEFVALNHTRTHLRRCHGCVLARNRQKYKKNPLIGLRSTVKARARIRIYRERMMDYLSVHPCVDCGEDDPVVLDWDHVSGEKTMGISQMIESRSWGVIKAEMAKCEVRCSNCHRRRTAYQQGWFAYFGRDHVGEANATLRRARAAQTGQASLFADEAPQVIRSMPSDHILITNLADRLGAFLADNPMTIPGDGDVSVLAACTVMDEGVLRVREAVILDPREIPTVNPERGFRAHI